MENGGGIGGVIFEYTSIISDNDDLHPIFVSLLRKLRNSSINTAISYGPGLSSLKVNFLQTIGSQYSVDCFAHDNNSWSSFESRLVLYVVSRQNKDLFRQQRLPNSHLVVVDNEGNVESSSQDSIFTYINKLEELPLTISRLNRKQAHGNDLVTVGYTMKASRVEDFAKRGAFPMNPTPNGLMFLPLTFEISLPLQLQQVDILLHKATDEIVSIDLSGSAEFPNSAITYSAGMEELKRYMEHHLDLCVIDPLTNIYPVLDRLKIQQILLGLEDLKVESSLTIRGPHFLKVDDYNETDLVHRLSKAELILPSIVKPQIACGVADAHSMAIVFKVEDFKDLCVPLPAIIQEYVDHSSTLYKFYVLGEKVFHAVKKSTPNADILMKLSPSPELKPLLFDSLKSLPTANSGDTSSSKSIDHDLVNKAALWLMGKLGLTIFGFDVVVEEGSGDHVIVDVNYLPSFKEVPDDIAIPIFWDSIKKKFESHGTKSTQSFLMLC